MSRMMLMVVVAAALIMPSAAVAHEGHEHTVLGMVAAVDKTHIEVHSTEGKHVSILFDGETRFRIGDSGASADDVKVGERVAVRFVEKDGKLYARDVRLATDQK